MAVELSGITAIMLGVRNLDQSTAFYQGKLGLKLLMKESDALALLEAGAVRLGLSTGHVRLAPQPAGATEVVFQVARIRAAYDAMKQEGMAFLSEPRQVTNSDWAAHFRDPDGHLLSIFGPE
jgi:catechol 2,3-dioxygenase-like lactoylglutathione lyase family enzyme